MYYNVLVTMSIVDRYIYIYIYTCMVASCNVHISQVPMPGTTCGVALPFPLIGMGEKDGIPGHNLGCGTQLLE